MNPVFAQTLAFLSVVLVVLTADWTYRNTKGKRDASKTVRRPPFFEWFEIPIAFLGPLAFSYVSAVSPRKITVIRQQLVTAGLQGKLEARDIVGGQAFAALLGGGLAFFGVMIADFMAPVVVLATAAGAFLGWVYPGIWIAKASETRKLLIAKQLPYALDLLTTAIESGQDFNAALRYLTRHGLTAPLSDELETTLGEIDLGQSRQQALRKFADRIPCDELAQLVSAVIQSMETGASLSGTLRMLSQDLRRMRFHRAERQAARAPSLMIIPMVLFIVPGIFIIVFTPVILRVLQATGKM